MSPDAATNIIISTTTMVIRNHSSKKSTSNTTPIRIVGAITNETPIDFNVQFFDSQRMVGHLRIIYTSRINYPNASVDMGVHWYGVLHPDYCRGNRCNNISFQTQ